MLSDMGPQDLAEVGAAGVVLSWLSEAWKFSRGIYNRSYKNLPVEK